jgi:hypothetical protein
MKSLNELSESGALEYIRAELQVLQPILGESISVFWKALVEQWEREGRPGISPVDRQYALDELSKMAAEWLQTQNTLRAPDEERQQSLDNCIDLLNGVPVGSRD